MSDSPPRIALVSGSSTGIGHACALRLARRGWKVFAGVRKEPDGDRLRQQAPERIQPVLLDVESEASVRAAVETVRAASGGRLDALVNNAGIVVGGPMELLPLADLRRQFEVNVFGAVGLTQACLPLLRAARGRVVNMSSVSGRVSFPLLGAYCASKFALEAVSDAMRRELAPWGIRVAIVEPGAVATPIWQKSGHDAEDRFRHLPPASLALYKDALEVLPKIVKEGEKRGIPAEKVAIAVEHALTARAPRIRYAVGNDSRLGGMLARVVPDRLVDWMIQRDLGI